MIRQVAWRLRFRMRFEVSRRADNRGALVGGDSHGDHVAVDELAEVDAGIEMAGHEVEAHLVGRCDVEDDIGIGAREWAEFGASTIVAASGDTTSRTRPAGRSRRLRTILSDDDIEQIGREMMSRQKIGRI